MFGIRKFTEAAAGASRPSTSRRRPLLPLPVVALFVVVASACGGASATDFDTDGAAGDSTGSGGSGSGRGGSAGAPSGGSNRGGTSAGGTSAGGTSAGGTSAGGTSTGGTSTGGTSGSATGGQGGTESGGASTGGMGGTEPGGGTGGLPNGGTGQGGSGGAPQGGTGGNDCAATVSNAQTALTSAQICDPSAASSCTGTVEDLCGCTVPVNDEDSPATKSYLAQREAALECGVACPRIPCHEPTKATCGVAAAGADRIIAVGSCVWAPR